MNDDCVFCKVLAGELPGSFVHRDDLCAAFMDAQPITPGHTLVVPVIHVTGLAELDGTTATCLLQTAQRVAAALRRSDLRCEGVNLLLADGEVAGQEMPHLHLHVLPRFAGDGFGFRFPPDHSKTVERETLEASAASIRDAMENPEA
jgi:histidine triad (HIT) family protein